MERVRFLVAAVAVALVALVAAPFAAAEATRTWVSGVGDDANPCSRTAPCKTFAGAISKTASPGIIMTLDSGGFGAVTITKSITIDGGGYNAGILASGTQGVVINGTGIDVTLRRLSIEGEGTTLGTNGVNFLAGNSLVLSHVHVHDFSNTGLWMHNPGHFEVRDSEFERNKYGIASSGTGAGASMAKGVVANSYFSFGQYGIYVGTSSHVTALDSVASDNSTAGFESRFGGTLELEHGVSEGNATGLLSDGAGSYLLASNMTVTDNTTGVNALNSGQTWTRGNNTVEGNNTNGTFTNTYAGK